MSLHEICGLSPPNQKSWLRLCTSPAVIIELSQGLWLPNSNFYPPIQMHIPLENQGFCSKNYKPRRPGSYVTFLETKNNN